MTREEYRNGGAYLTAARGSQLPQARLTPADVRNIRRSGQTARQLAEQFGVHIRTIDKVRQFISWRHITC